jgi:hypothetical protein
MENSRIQYYCSINVRFGMINYFEIELSSGCESPYQGRIEVSRKTSGLR